MEPYIIDFHRGRRDPDSQVVVMRTINTAILVLITITLVLSPHSAVSSDRISVQKTNGGTISLKAENAPLREVINELSLKCGFDLKGILLSADSVDLKLSDSSLDETLRRLLRGYNYVVISGEESQRGSLMILSKAERVALANTPPPPPPASTTQTAMAVPSQSPLVQAASPVPENQGSVPAGGASRPPGVPPAAFQRSSPAPIFGPSPLPQGTGAHVTTAGETMTTIAPPGMPQIAGFLETPPMPPSMPLAPSVAPISTVNADPITIITPPQEQPKMVSPPPERPVIDLTPPKMPF
jgi:hypothetical protein